ncbi:SpoIIE family protein phosphatase [Streptomyces lunaelactis]|nr:SpoIIE family protein phosphatase [Streptomyces lunaelactis]NUK02592.1 SpoIIE family protein phosphatase [Streptomyces lunaelactis]NUK08943.1 SpoIIE family protein phosphatase [Streptomyces lunaelactis]NUK16775.1 SpoIIE family protein phosphatase [Streptomyces lunaelactis]NUK35581.1 SpoIIE family protein phosphatase [Streptomyces lunaelactis]NUK42475.1 SpoIIE family protein phosphatase [Streptomyces lunaelactis]
MSTVRERIRVFGGAALAAVYVPGKRDDTLQLVESAGGSGARYGLLPSYPLSAHAPVVDAFRTGRPLWLNAVGVASYGESGPETLPAQISLGALPLGANGQPVGCLVVVDDVADGFDAERRNFLELYADQVTAWLEAGGEPNTHAIGRTGPRPMLGPALDRFCVGSFTLVLSTGQIDADSRVLDLVDIPQDAFDGRVETLLAHTVPDDLPSLMSIVEPGHMTSGGRELEFRIRRPTGELRWLRLRARRLADGGGKPERVLGVVADAAHLRPSADEVSRVQRLSVALAGAMTVRDVSRAVVAALRDPLGADRVALAELEADRLVVTVLDPPEPEAWPELWRSEWRSEWPDAPARALPTLEAALREGRMSLWTAGSALEPGLAGIGPGGLAVLALPAEGRVVGSCLIGWDEPHEFGPEERSLLTATAGLVGQALVRARSLDAEHELATMLQRSLLPRKLPNLPGGVAVARYLPATVGLAVGGDWYDVIPLSENHVALVVGDVQGHNAGAATIMGQMRTAIRAYAVEGHPPDVVVSRANRLLVGMETDLFATCCYVAIDMEEGDAWCVRAGHLPPLLRDPDGSTREVVIEGGPPLGVLAEAEFPMTTVALAPGAVLTLLTDGLVESSSLHLEDGMRRVCDALSTADPTDVGRMADQLLGGVNRRDDDVALLLLRYDGIGVRPLRAGWTVWRLPDAVAHARRFTSRMLRSWRVTEERDAILLIVSELVTNALVHTQGQVRLDLTLTGERLRVAVSDASPRAPVKPATMNWEATGGRGILLVQAVSASYGSVPLSGGKQVWAEVALQPREPGVTTRVP